MMRRLPPRRRLLAVPAFLMLGAVASVALALLIAGTVDPRLGVVDSGTSFDGEARWTVTRATRFGGVHVQSDRDASGAWSPRQATGAPDTPVAADSHTAWATLGQDDPGEWLEVLFATPVVPKAVRVHENYMPGAVVRVSVSDGDGREVTAWAGTDPVQPPAASGVATLPLGVDFPVQRVKLYLDSVTAKGWNEIDAVGLEDAAGSVQWAVRARASSYYGGGAADPQAAAAVRAVLPAWSGLDRPGAAFAAGASTRDVRSAVAFGWPFLVVRGERDDTPATAAPAGLTPLGGGLTVAPVATSTWTTAFPAGGLAPGPRTGGVLTGTSLAQTSTALVYLGPAGGPALPATASTLPAPTRVLWPGLAANAAVYALLLFLLRWLLLAPTRLMRELTRMRGGRCIRCGYDLGYDFVRGCPECGWRRDQSPAPREAGAARNGRPAPVAPREAATVGREG